MLRKLNFREKQNLLSRYGKWKTMADELSRRKSRALEYMNNQCGVGNGSTEGNAMDLMGSPKVCNGPITDCNHAHGLDLSKIINEDSGT
jgi:hypothetical protein